MMLLPARSLHIFHAIAIVAEILVQKKKKKKNRGRTFVHAKKIVLKTIKTKKRKKKLKNYYDLVTDERAYKSDWRHF